MSGFLSKSGRECREYEARSFRRAGIGRGALLCSTLAGPLEKRPAVGSLALAIRYMIFTHLPSVTRFPALATSDRFSRACHQLYVFPRLPPVTSFSAFDTSYKFSRVCHQLYVFPRLPSVLMRFPALAIWYMLVL